MIKKYHLYLANSLIIPLLTIAITITTIIWLSQATRIISSIAASGSGILNFIELSSLLIPSLMAIIIPIANFIAVLYVYNKLLIDSELVSLEAAGISRFQLSLPAINISIITAIICYAISLYLVPIANAKFKDDLFLYRNNFSSIYLEEEVFNTNINNITIYIDERTEDGDLKGILVNDERDPFHRVTMLANSGKLSKINDVTRFELFNGSRQEIDKNGQLAILYFDHFNYDLSLANNKHMIRHLELQEMDLKTLINSKNSSDKLNGKIRAEINQRLCWPLYGILLTIIGLLALTPAEFNRKSKSRRIIKYTICAIISVILYFIGNNFAAKSMFFAFLPLVNLLFWISFYSYLLFFRKVS
jgi:lipopolysaccharide export system permease protein